MTALSIQHERYGPVPIVVIDGAVESIDAPRLREEVLQAARNDDRGLVLDLTDASYIDSAGVNTLFEAAERFAARQLRFGLVVADGGLIGRVLSIVAIDSVAEVHPTREATVAAVCGCPDLDPAPSET